MILNSVVLPEPLAPVSTIELPDAALKSTPRKTRFRPKRR